MTEYQEYQNRVLSEADELIVEHVDRDGVYTAEDVPDLLVIIRESYVVGRSAHDVAVEIMDRLMVEVAHAV